MQAATRIVAVSWGVLLTGVALQGFSRVKRRDLKPDSPLNSICTPEFVAGQFRRILVPW